MKYIFTLCFIAVFFNSFSQSEEEKIYDRYFLKSRTLTGNQMVAMNENLRVSRMGPKSFYIEININKFESFVIAAEYEESYEFAGNMIYSYNGLGRFDDMELNFAVESRVKLGEVAKGKAFDEETSNSVQDFEIHIFFWPYGTSEPLTKSNIYVYPIAQSKEQDYIQHDGWKELNIPHIIKRAKPSSAITGTYLTEYDNMLQMVELQDGQILFKLSLGNSRNVGFLEGLVKPQNGIAVFEKEDFGLCKFKLNIQENKVEISTLDNGTSCGFGNGLYADGIFSLDNRDLPVFVD